MTGKNLRVKNLKSLLLVIKEELSVLERFKRLYIESGIKKSKIPVKSVNKIEKYISNFPFLSIFEIDF